MLLKLKERDRTLKREVRTRYFKQQANLCVKKKYAELSKVYNEGFVSVGEEIMRDGEDIASVNFWT